MIAQADVDEMRQALTWLEHEFQLAIGSGPAHRVICEVYKGRGLLEAIRAEQKNQPLPLAAQKLTSAQKRRAKEWLSGGLVSELAIVREFPQGKLRYALVGRYRQAKMGQLPYVDIATGPSADALLRVAEAVAGLAEREYGLPSLSINDQRIGLGKGIGPEKLVP